MGSLGDAGRPVAAAWFMRTIARVIGVQLAVTLAGIVLFGLLKGPVGAVSAGIGGAIGFVPSAVYAVTLRMAGASPEQQLRMSYVAEVLKILTTLALFAATFIVFRGLVFWALFLTYLGTLATYWFALLFDMKTNMQQKK